MPATLRPSGIDSLGEVPWGTHLCQFYRTRKDQLDLLCDWFQAGLKNGESCLWISPDSVKAAAFMSAMQRTMPGFSRHLNSGQMEVVPFEKWYLDGGRFIARRVHDRWQKKLQDGLKRGYAGLRVAGEPVHLNRRHWKRICRYESEFNSLIQDLPILSLCFYPKRGHGIGDAVDVIHHHHCALIRRGTGWARIESVGTRFTETKPAAADPLPGTHSPFFADTARKRTETELRESQRRLKILSARLINAQEDERRRIAKELHDGIGQILTAIKFGVENCMQTAQCQSAFSCRDSLITVIAAVQNGIDEIRRISGDLWPSMLSDLGILPTVDWYCREFQNLYAGIRIAKMIEVTEADIPNPLKITLYRVLQEATNNAAKHSKCDLVSLSLQKKDGALEMIVCDNGRGFDVPGELSRHRPDRGQGLSSMRERTELSGGSFHLSSDLASGTVIRTSWKL
jgi:signal transduction histidine kinase